MLRILPMPAKFRGVVLLGKLAKHSRH